LKLPRYNNTGSAAETIVRLIELRLNTRLRDEVLPESTVHPDEDMMNAFVEGQLTDVESRHLVSHLVRCAACLHLTAQMISHEPEVDQLESPATSADERGPLQRFLDSLASGLVPATNEDAVFAYEEKKSSEEEENDDDPAV